MTKTPTLTRTSRGKRYPRVLGSLGGVRPGPTFVVIGGIHGNEPGGAEAVLRVVEALRELEPSFRGRLLGLAGNLAALECRRRYLDQDLNRVWAAESVASLRAQEPERDSFEQKEQRELIAVLDDLLDKHDDVLVLDLHSSSAAGAPFSCMGDTIRNRRIAFALPIPVILGLEEAIDGGFLDWVYRRGHVAVAVEGGRHGEVRTVENLESALWLSLVAAGCLLANEVPDIELHRRRLSNATAGIPSVIEIRHREKLVLEDTFEMVGDREYRSFDVVHKGTLVARRNGRDVLVPETGRLLLPLYQGQGSDGFFIGRRVRPFWLALSKWLRRIRFSRTLLLLLPGVHRHPTLPDAFVVDPRIARTKPVEVFHLLGFRRRRWEDGKLVFTRRNEGTPRVL